MSAQLTKYYARSSCVSFSMTISDLLALIELPTFTLKSSTIIFSENGLIWNHANSLNTERLMTITYNGNNFIDLHRTNLIGIVGKSSNPSALLRLSNGKIIKLKVGQWFEGWRVFAIDRDKIHVENGFKQEILRMPG